MFIAGGVDAPNVILHTEKIVTFQPDLTLAPTVPKST